MWYSIEALISTIFILALVAGMIIAIAIGTSL